jgi:hypothetical protein
VALSQSVASAGSSRLTLRERPARAPLGSRPAVSGGLLGFVGTNWDELWHCLYGGFGTDFLWPPTC